MDGVRLRGGDPLTAPTVWMQGEKKLIFVTSVSNSFLVFLPPYDFFYCILFFILLISTIIFFFLLLSSLFYYLCSVFVRTWNVPFPVYIDMCDSIYFYFSHVILFPSLSLFLSLSISLSLFLSLYLSSFLNLSLSIYLSLSLSLSLYSILVHNFFLIFFFSTYGGSERCLGRVRG